MNKLRCIDCGFEVTEKEAEEKKLTCCPNCNSASIPMSSANDIELKINWQELRILVIWAERFAVAASDKSMSPTLYSIASRIKDQFKKLAVNNPLTLADDLGAVRDAGFEVESTFPGVEDVSTDLKRKKPDNEEEKK